MIDPHSRQLARVPRHEASISVDAWVSSDGVKPLRRFTAVSGRHPRDGDELLRRVTPLIVPFLVVLGLASPEVASATETFEAQFRQRFGRGVGAFSGPAAVAFCGTGQVVGYGEAELTIVATSAEPTSAPGCGLALAVTGIATIELEDGSTLVLDEAGIDCLPGGSHFAPGNFFVSYGNPFGHRGDLDSRRGLRPLRQSRRERGKRDQAGGRYSGRRVLGDPGDRLR
jgi:hypothetical protein